MQSGFDKEIRSYSQESEHVYGRKIFASKPHEIARLKAEQRTEPCMSQGTQDKSYEGPYLACACRGLWRR